MNIIKQKHFLVNKKRVFKNLMKNNIKINIKIK